VSEPSNAVQKALYQALTVGSPAPLSAAVYDHVPQNASYPYVVIDAQETAEDDHLTEQLDERFIYLSVWSRQRGQKEVNTLIGQIHDALHQQRFALDVGRMVNCLVIRKRSGLDADGLTYQGSVTVKVRTEH
jgi:hypothetical protein